jgi:hypothetical protein
MEVISLKFRDNHDLLRAVEAIREKCRVSTATETTDFDDYWIHLPDSCGNIEQITTICSLRNGEAANYAKIKY